jgi:hypothetical protein
MNECLAGLTTGFIQTILFNPIDRALYLHMCENNKLFTRSNWQNPYQGVTNAIYSRVIAYGFYYAIIDHYKNMVNSFFTNNNNITKNTIAGIMVGITTSLMLNPFTVIKYYTWKDKNNVLNKVAKDLIKRQRYKILTHGLSMTITRDIVFSVGYLNIKDWYKKYDDNKLSYFLLNMAGVAIATIASSPFNYVRTKIFENGFDKKINMLKTLKDLHNESIINKPYTKYMLKRLCIGYGTLRVAVGINSGQLMYDYFIKKFVIETG